MMEGEYHSLSAIREAISDFAPKPYARGRFKKSVVDTHFLLMDFLYLNSTGPVNTEYFCAEITKLHLTSISPTGKFGFHITT